MRAIIRYNDKIFDVNDFKYIKDKYELDIRSYGLRAGAIDLVTIIDFALGTIAGEIIYDYLKGVTNFNLAEELGKVSRKYLIEVNELIQQIYKNHCQDKLLNSYAVAYVDYFDGFSIYAVLNHADSSIQLIKKLGNTLLNIYNILPTLIEQIDDEIIVIQVYPDFELDEWRYLFIPSTQAFGKYIDRVYDMKYQKFIYFDSNTSFGEKFKPNIADKYKFVISYERDIDK